MGNFKIIIFRFSIMFPFLQQSAWKATKMKLQVLLSQNLFS
jgi:hypothetical protein